MTKVSPARPRGPRTAFVLSGGGHQGVSQVGMLRALVERAIEPDVIIGTSVGALNGAVVATSPVPAQIDHLEDVWRGLTGDRVFVSELYIGQVSVHNLATGRTRPVASIADQVGLEWKDGDLWSTYDAFGEGAIGIVQR